MHMIKRWRTYMVAPPREQRFAQPDYKSNWQYWLDAASFVIDNDYKPTPVAVCYDNYRLANWCGYKGMH